MHGRYSYHFVVYREVKGSLIHSRSPLVNLGHSVCKGPDRAINSCAKYIYIFIHAKSTKFRLDFKSPWSQSKTTFGYIWLKFFDARETFKTGPSMHAHLRGELKWVYGNVYIIFSLQANVSRYQNLSEWLRSSLDVFISLGFRTGRGNEMEICERGMDSWWESRAVEPKQHLRSSGLTELRSSLDETADLFLQDKTH